VLAPSIRFNYLRSCFLNLHDDGPSKARINADYIKNEVFALKKTRQTSLRKKDAAVSKLVKEVMDTKKLEHMIQLLYSCSQARIVLSDKNFIAFNSLLEKKYKYLSTFNLGRMLYGLGSASSESPLVRQYIATISNKCIVEKRTEVNTPVGISMSFYGLKKMSSEHAEVRSLVGYLENMLMVMPLPLGAQAVGNSLYGLQSMNSAHPEVRALVRTLAGKVANCQEELKSQAIGNCFYGLKGMSSDHAESSCW
jgi:hypothetical protein